MSLRLSVERMDGYVFLFRLIISGWKVLTRCRLLKLVIGANRISMKLNTSSNSEVCLSFCSHHVLGSHSDAVLTLDVGTTLVSWSWRYKVKGLDKDYEAFSEFTR